MSFQDYINDPASAYNGTDSSGMTSTAGWLGTPYRQGDQSQQQPQQQQPQQQYQATSIPGAAQPSGNGYAPQRMNVPGQSNFDAIQKSIMAQQSPYVSFGANGWLQNNHPGIAHGLDNAFLAAANTTTGRTTAENISGVARGVIGGRQEALQHNVQQALLPVELAQRQFAFQKSYLDVQKDQAQIGMDNENASRYHEIAANQRRLSQSPTAQYSSQRVGTNGLLYGTRKDNNQEEVIPGQPGMEDYDASDPSKSKGAFAVPGAGSGKPNMTQLYIAASQGDKGAQAAIDAYAKANAGLAGAKTGAVNNANTPKNFLESENKASLDQIGAAPKSTHQDYQSFRNSQLTQNVPFDKIPDEDTWSKQNALQYNTAKSAAQRDNSDYTKSKAWQRGISMKDWKTQRAQTQQTPGAAKQIAPVGMPGTAQQAPAAHDPIGIN